MRGVWGYREKAGPVAWSVLRVWEWDSGLTVGKGSGDKKRSNRAMRPGCSRFRTNKLDYQLAGSASLSDEATR